jgi:hypothetical protein
MTEKISGFIVVQVTPQLERFHGPFGSADEAVKWMLKCNDFYAGFLCIREIYVPNAHIGSNQ